MISNQNHYYQNEEKMDDATDTTDTTINIQLKTDNLFLKMLLKGSKCNYLFYHKFTQSYVLMCKYINKTDYKTNNNDLIKNNEISGKRIDYISNSISPCYINKCKKIIFVIVSLLEYQLKNRNKIY